MLIMRLLAVLALLAVASSAVAKERVALIIGNGAYENATALPNPKNDADDTKRLLMDLGFEVIHGVDLDRDEMETTIRQFAASSASASVVLFFYAGHGMQVDGQNYLIPIDAKLEERTALDFEAINVDKVLRYMSGDDKVALVFLDACRNNPLARTFARSLGPTRATLVGGGLAPTTTAGSGLFIAYATAPNDVALDGAGRNSPFTAALLHHLPTPNLEIQQVMTRVKATVQNETQGRQRPWHNSDLGAEVFLVTAPTTPLAVDDQQPHQIWLELKTSNDVTALQGFVQRFPNSKEAIEARFRLDQLAAIPKPPFEPSVPSESAALCRRLSEVLLSDKVAGVPGTRPDQIYGACKKAVAEHPEDGELAWAFLKSAQNIGQLQEYDQYLAIAANLGHPDALYSYAYALTNSWLKDSIPFDPSRAESIALKRMDRKHWRTAFLLSIIYETGPLSNTAKRDEWSAQVDKLLEAAVEQREVDALVWLAQRKKEASSSEAEALLAKIEPGNVHALWALSDHYSKRDIARARVYADSYASALRSRAERGSADALNSLGYHYWYGPTKDRAKAAEAFKEAVDAGYVQAIDSLVRLYEDKDDRRFYNPQLARYWRLQYVARTDSCPPGDATILSSLSENIPRLSTPDEAARCYLEASKTFSLIHLSLSRTHQRTPQSVRIAIQRVLAEKGFYNGKLDGQLGKATTAAFNSYVQSP